MTFGSSLGGDLQVVVDTHGPVVLIIEVYISCVVSPRIIVTDTCNHTAVPRYGTIPHPLGRKFNLYETEVLRKLKRLKISTDDRAVKRRIMLYYVAPGTTVTLLTQLND